MLAPRFFPSAVKRCVMAKSKRSAEDIARLFHREHDRLSPSEWAEISAWLKIEIRKTTRSAWMMLPIAIFVVFCAYFSLAALVLSAPPKPSGMFEYIPFFFVGTLVVHLCLIPRQLHHRKCAFLHGFIRGIRVSEPGAPKKWTMDVRKEAVAAVRALVVETGMGVARSIEILKKRDPERWQTLNESRYYEAVRQLKKST
jgi:hypothetical protein